MSKTIVETVIKETIFDKDGQVFTLVEIDCHDTKRVVLKYRDYVNVLSIHFDSHETVREMAKAMLEAVK
jgi:hypothetical protein